MILFLGNACQKSPFLTLDSPSVIDLSTSNNETIRFTVNRDWTASSSASWLTVSPIKGHAADGPVHVTVRASNNDTFDIRTATVTIMADGLTQTVTVRQPAFQGVKSLQRLYELSLEAQTIEVAVQTNVPFKVETNGDWIQPATTKGATTEHLVFHISENKTYSSREGIVSFQAEGGDLLEAVVIQQDGRIAVTSLELDKKNLRLRENQTASLTATVSPQNATDKTVH